MYKFLVIFALRLAFNIFTKNSVKFKYKIGIAQFSLIF